MVHHEHVSHQELKLKGHAKGFVSYLGLWKIRDLLTLKNNLTEYTCPDLKVLPLGMFHSVQEQNLAHLIWLSWDWLLKCKSSRIPWLRPTADLPHRELVKSNKERVMRVPSYILWKRTVQLPASNPLWLPKKTSVCFHSNNPPISSACPAGF